MSDNNRDRDQGQDQDDEPNPFVAFRRFADEGISAIFAGLSEIVENAVKRSGEDQKRQQPQQPNQQYGNAEEHDNSHAPRGNPKAPYDGQSALYKEIDRHLTARRLHFHTPEHLNAETPDWHPFFFVKHPHSPLQLERHPTTRKIGISWRDACEDLLLVERDMPIADRGNKNNDVVPRETPKDWIVGLISKGLTSLGRIDKGETPLLPPDQDLRRSPTLSLHDLASQQFSDPNRVVRLMLDTESPIYPLFRGIAAVHDENLAEHREDANDLAHQQLADPTSASPIMPGHMGAVFRLLHAIAAVQERNTAEHEGVVNKHPETELDMYEQFLDRHSTPPTTSEDRGHPFSLQSSESPQPSIISTLTRTQRNVAPDGTVTTKTVTKRRFADGKEESEETTDTVHGARPVRAQIEPAKMKDVTLSSVLADIKRRRETQKEDVAKKDCKTQKDGGAKKESNWFWSSW